MRVIRARIRQRLLVLGRLLLLVEALVPTSRGRDVVVCLLYYTAS